MFPNSTSYTRRVKWASINYVWKRNCDGGSHRDLPLALARRRPEGARGRWRRNRRNGNTAHLRGLRGHFHRAAVAYLIDEIARSAAHVQRKQPPNRQTDESDRDTHLANHLEVVEGVVVAVCMEELRCARMHLPAMFDAPLLRDELEP